MSKKFEWLEEYSVGVTEFDEQHRKFFQIANDLLEMAESDEKDLKELVEKLDELGNYASYHLGIEEEAFNKFGYDKKEEHIKAHDVFRDEIQKRMDKAREMDEYCSKTVADAADFAGSWFVDHIMNTDQQYKDFLKEKGLK